MPPAVMPAASQRWPGSVGSAISRKASESGPYPSNVRRHQGRTCGNSAHLGLLRRAGASHPTCLPLRSETEGERDAAAAPPGEGHEAPPVPGIGTHFVPLPWGGAGLRPSREPQPPAATAHSAQHEEEEDA